MRFGVPMTFLPLDIAVPQHLRMRASFPMRTFAVFLATIFISITPADASGPGKENDFAGRRVLLIGIDGCRADALRAAMGSGKASPRPSGRDRPSVMRNQLPIGDPRSPIAIIGNCRLI